MRGFYKGHTARGGGFVCGALMACELREVKVICSST
jgi:hypothetical protein